MSPEEKEALRRKGAKWPWIIASIIGTNLLAVAALIYFAHAESGHSIEPDYYKKALAWDKEMAQQRRNQQLGWKLALDFSPRADAPRGRGDAWLVVRAKDGLGRPLEGAQVAVEAYSKRMAVRRHRLVLRDRGSGRYATPIRLRPLGLWRFEIAVTHRDQRFTTRLDEDVPLL